MKWMDSGLGFCDEGKAFGVLGRGHEMIPLDGKVGRANMHEDLKELDMMNIFLRLANDI